jgi:hypothetical protein
MDKKEIMYTLNVTKEQLQLISKALDFYSRVGIGQFKEIVNHPTFENNIYKKCTPKRVPVVGDRTTQGEIIEIKDNKALISGSVNKENIWCVENEWKNLEDVQLSTDYTQFHFIKDMAEDSLNTARNILYMEPGYSKNGHWGIYNDGVDDSCRVAYDIHQDIRHQFWKESEYKSDYTVDSSVSYSSIKSTPVKITKDEDLDNK